MYLQNKDPTTFWKIYRYGFTYKWILKYHHMKMTKETENMFNA